VFTAGAVDAPCAGSIERVVRDLPLPDRPDLVQGRYKLPPVAGLDGMKPCHAIRDIFHKPAADLVSGHFLQADGAARDAEPVRAVGPEREGPGGTDNGKCTIRIDPVHHPDDIELFRYDLDICLLCRFPFAAPAGSDTGVQERAEFRTDAGPDRKNFLPNQLRIKGSAEVVRELFADGIPVGFGMRLVLFIIVPHRTGMAADKVGDADKGMHAMFLMVWLGSDWVILIAGGNAENRQGAERKNADPSFLSRLKIYPAFSYLHENVTNVFIPAGHTCTP
jgi:hypothetical protein